MDLVGRIWLFSGVIITVAAQLWIVVHAFKDSFIHGVSCLIVPAYVIYYAVIRKETRHAAAILLWLTGIAVMIAGMVLIS